MKRISKRVGFALSAAITISSATAQTPKDSASSLVQIDAASGLDLVVTDPSEALIQGAAVTVSDDLGIA
jgi:hypothetical protein